VFASEKVWGQYNNYRANGWVGSGIVHVVLMGLVLASAVFGHQVVRQAKQRDTVTIIAPSPDSYILRTFKKVVSGGGGDHDGLPPLKGRMLKFAMEQITPPQIVVRNQKPKLTAEPTVIVPPQVHLAENRMPNFGIPSAASMPAAPPSNGSGSGGGLGVGRGAGVGPCAGGGIGGGVFKVGGRISAPHAVSTPDPEYTEEARNAKKQGTCTLWLIVDTTGHPRDI
jgi:hypothetical protein